MPANKEIVWHETQWQEILRAGLESLPQLPHALLLNGSPGLGKRQFGEELAALLLCESPRALHGTRVSACGHCQGCHWLSGNNHPDFRRLSPEGEEDGEEGDGPRKEKKRGASQIKIDAIRALEDFVFVGSHRHGRRVVLITEAEAMNMAAANSLLKILEEPPATVYFILVTSRSRQLLATIRSRCRVVNFKRPEDSIVATWWQESGLPKTAERYLPLAGGAPLTVLEWQEKAQIDAHESLIQSLLGTSGDPLTLANQWDSLLKRHPQFNLEMLVEGVQRWLFDMSLSTSAGDTRFHRGWKLPATERLRLPRVIAGWRELLRFRRSARHPLNQLLFLEDLAAHTLRALQTDA